MDSTAAYYDSGVQRATVPLSAPRAINPSCFSALGGREAEIAALAKRLSEIVDRLCGPDPTDESPLNKVASFGGLFGEIDETCNRFAARVAQMKGDLDRLEKRLP